MHKSVGDTYDELYHYTTKDGLYGIIESQQLRATNIAYLNDAEEHTGFFDRRLPHLLAEPVKAALAEHALSEFGRQAIEESGGLEKAAADLIDGFRKDIRTSSLNFNEPYIASFCVPPHVDPNDGLLSQWRGYGIDGGYALVFSTKGIEQLVNIESKAFHYQTFFMGNVEYYDQDTAERAAFSETLEFEAIIQKAIRSFVLNPEAAAFEPMFDPITYLSCTHKHRGFREEAEVRIGAIPSNGEILEMARSTGDIRAAKEIHFRSKGGMLIPYINLFGNAQEGKPPSLPIKKIIVGPHPNKANRRKAIEMLVQKHKVDAEVVLSDIPYLGY